MTKWKKLSHTIYQCKYQIVWCPKYRYKILKGLSGWICGENPKYAMWMEEYRDTGNECKRGPYTYYTFYPSQIIDIRSNGNAKR